MDKAIDLLKPGRVAPTAIAAALPTAEEIGFASEMDAFGLNFCHGLGLGLHERPLISRLNSFKEPIELKVGMVFAVETYCPATDGDLGGAHRGGGDPDADGAEDHLALSGGGTADRESVLSACVVASLSGEIVPERRTDN